MAWRDTKASARETVHQTMKVPAVLLTGSDSNGVSLGQFDIRVHEKQTAIGDQPGTSLNSAERFEPIPRLIFWRADLISASVSLVRGLVVSVTEGEAYFVEVVKPHDQETITAEVTRLDAEDAAGLPLPV